jgi:hypothetical protein
MIVKDVINILLDFPMDSPCLVFTKEEDLSDVIGEELPDLRFGTIKVSSADATSGENKEVETVVIIGNFNKYTKEEGESNK